MHRVTIIPGDGIGPEVAGATRRIVDATEVSIEWDQLDVEPLTDRRGERHLHPDWLDSIYRNKTALKGPITTPIGEGHRSLNVALRQELNLYANLRPIKNFPGVKARYENVDLVIVRENTEGLYSGLEHQVVPGVVESLKIVTEVASTRIARFAFDYARQHNRKTVCAVHKANILKLSDGLFLDSCRRVAKEFPEIEYKELIIDNACMQLVLNPERHDLLVMENLYGDIVSDLCAGLVGGLGVVPSGNIGEDYAVFEAVHGSAPDIAGQDKANPTALTLSACLMLEHLGETAAAENIRQALVTTYTEGRHLTPDVGGAASTTEFTEAVIEALSSPTGDAQAARTRTTAE